jgi:hypothetical protein
MFRQGDVLLLPVESVPDGERLLPEDGRLILARGEVTGHHHSVAAADGALVEAAEGVYLRIMAPTPLEHQEHDAIWLAPGAYRVVRQREYSPGAISQVRD